MSIGYIPKRPSGLDSEALFFQAVWDKLWGGQARMNPGRGARVNLTTRGMQVLPEVGKQAATTTGLATPGTRFRVKAMYQDHYICRTWNGTDEGASDVRVAKPPELRHSRAGATIEGVAVTYTYATRANNVDGERHAAGSGYLTQLEIVLPVWTIDAVNEIWTEIWADQPTGGTGVVVNSSDEEPNPIGDTVVTWMDQNCDARYWYQIGLA